VKDFDQINRRTHLYLGLFLIPWLLMYGLSSILISHNTWFRSAQSPVWRTLFERDYHRAVPENAELREVAREILKDCNLEGAFWVQRPNADELRINRFRFWNDTRLTYSIKDQRLRAEQQQYPWNQVLVRLHFRGGFLQPTVWDTLWAVLVDVACVGILIWVASGLIMWWRLVRLRVWGAFAFGGGLLTFLLFLWRL
jgi:hypothetical protein